MKINGNQVRKGTLLLFEDGLWRVMKTEATKTGKSGAYNQVEMKNITSGIKKNVRFRASETVERARLDDKDCVYLYDEGDNAVFMNSDDYEQFYMALDTIGDDAIFLEDGMAVRVEFHEETPLSVILPAQVTLTVEETEPVVKGQTASASFKPAVLSNGLRTGVPQFVNTGDQIVVDTAERSYLRRADT